jgi:hypothetical protein
MNPTNNPHDDDLRASLHALRREGEENAPSFSQTWRAAKARQQTPAPSWRLAWAAVTFAVLAIVAVIVVPRPSKETSVATAHVQPVPAIAMHQEPAPPAAVPGLTDEGLPTDFLLTTNNDDSVARVAGEIDALLRP